MCNLNFNQCNLGCSYPRPIDTCRRQLYSLFNQGTMTILNPVSVQNFLYANSGVQTVSSGNPLLLQRLALIGQGIRDNGDGSYFLNKGIYQIEFSANGIIPASSQIELAVSLDGLIVENSRATTSSNFGMSADLSGSGLVNIGENGGLVALLNTGLQSVNFNRVWIIINKIN